MAWLALVLAVAAGWALGRWSGRSRAATPWAAQAFALSSRAMAVLDERLQLVQANPSLRRLLGDETVGALPESLHKVLSERLVAAEATEPPPFEYMLVMADASLRALRVELHRMEAADGNYLLSLSDVSAVHEGREAQARLRERAQALLQRVIDVIPHPVYVKDAGSRYLMVNEAFARGRGSSVAEVVGKTSFDLAPSSMVAAAINKEDEDVLGGASVFKEEHDISPATGRERYRIVTKGACEDFEGRRVIIGANFDVTSWRQTEAALQAALRDQQEQSERARSFAQRLIDVIPQPVYVKDPQSRYVMINEAFALERGETVADILGKSTAQLSTRPDVTKYVTGEDAAVLAGEIVFKEEHNNHIKTGKERFRIISKRACQYIDGTPVVVGTNFDITSWRVAERDLKHSLAEQSRLREFQQTVFDAVPSPLFVKSVEHRYIMANRAHADLFGYTIGEAFGKTTRDLMPEEIAATIVEREAQMLDRAPGEVVESELSLNDRVGLQHHLILREVVVKQGADTAPMMVGVLTDVTSLREAEAAAARANEAKSRFLANMSHELRTPMHGILSFTKLGVDRAMTSTPDKLRTYFERILTSGDRLLSLLNDLLDLSKMEARQMGFSYQLLDLRSVVADSIRDFDAWSAQKDIGIDLRADEVGLVKGDPIRLGQVMRNLLSNAIKYSPEHTRVVVTVNSCDDLAGAMIEVVVADQGVGIPEEELESVFDSFVQSSKTRTGAGGTGLGLAICREIVKAHGGIIFARLRQDRGTEFVMRVPLATSRRVAAAAA